MQPLLLIDFVNLFEGDISLPKFIEYVNSDNKDKSLLKQIGMKIDGKYLEIQNRSHPAGDTINLRPDYGDLKINEFGGLGESVARCLAENNPIPQEFVAVNDTFGESATPSQLMEKYNINDEAVVNAVMKVLKRK